MYYVHFYYASRVVMLLTILNAPTSVQAHPAATNFATCGATLLDSIIQTGDMDFEAAAHQAATPAVAAALKDGLDAKGLSHQEATKGFGLACG